MKILTLTPAIAIRYKLREKPHPTRMDDGFLIKLGQSIRITSEALTFFYAVDLSGKPTKAWKIQ